MSEVIPHPKRDTRHEEQHTQAVCSVDSPPGGRPYTTSAKCLNNPYVNIVQPYNSRNLRCCVPMQTSLMVDPRHPNPTWRNLRPGVCRERRGGLEVYSFLSPLCTYSASLTVSAALEKKSKRGYVFLIRNNNKPRSA